MASPDLSATNFTSSYSVNVFVKNPPEEQADRKEADPQEAQERWPLGGAQLCLRVDLWPAANHVTEVFVLVVPVARRVVDLGVRRTVGGVEPFCALAQNLLDLFLGQLPREGIGSL
jgi:hypothetical protein